MGKKPAKLTRSQKAQVQYRMTEFIIEHRMRGWRSIAFRLGGGRPKK